VRDGTEHRGFVGREDGVGLGQRRVAVDVLESPCDWPVLEIDERQTSPKIGVRRSTTSPLSVSLFTTR
jgi:hypothetical protein